MNNVIRRNNKMFQTDGIFTSLVNELNKLINEEIIITNEKGIIVASTAKNRVNDFHEGAFLAMEKREKMIMTRERTIDLKGVRKGIVLPIIIDGMPIGVLGITGNPRQVEPYALIVQKMSELFIQGTIDQMTKEDMARNLEFFAFDWLSGDLPEITLIEKAEFFNVKIKEYEQVLSFYMPKLKNNLTYRDLMRLRTWWDDKKRAIFLRLGQGKIVVIDKGYKKSVLKDKINSFVKNIRLEFEQEIFVGAGQRVQYNQLVDSYEQAMRACKIAEIKKSVIFDEELRFEILQYELKKETKERFIERTITSLLIDKILMKTLHSWLENNMSIKRTADSLYIHKNTLYYRLDRIEQLTGLHVRRIEDLALTFMALEFLKEYDV